jgi:hypothetical protein
MLAAWLELVIGIIGLKKCGDPAQEAFSLRRYYPMHRCFNQLDTEHRGWFLWLDGVRGFVLPILYIVGGVMIRKRLNASSGASCCLEHNRKYPVWAGSLISQLPLFFLKICSKFLFRCIVKHMKAST